jgi:hypothetical protein
MTCDAPSFRGLFGDDDPSPFFAAPPVFESEAERDAYAAAAAQGSNPARPHFQHGVSLLVDEEQLGILRDRRRQLRLELGDAWPQCREAFLNKRDAPMLPPGERALGPVLSQYVWAEGGDLPLPCVEDYERTWPGHWFGRAAAPAAALPAPPSWERRWGAVVFRGGATGAGVSPETNVRLRAAQLSAAWASCPRRRGLLDARLTSWNARWKVGPDGVMRVIERRRDVGSVGRFNYLSYERQAEYKYALYLPGNVGASRLGALLALGFVVLAPRSSAPHVWLWSRLQPYVHYVPPL